MKLTLLLMTFFCQLLAIGQGTINGNIHDKRENTGLEFCHVTIQEIKYSTFTDHEGNFKFENIPPGKYHLTAEDLRYCETTTEFTITNNDSLNINLELPPPCEYDKSIKDKTCPVCHKQDESIPILYGLIVTTKESNDNSAYNTYYPGGCMISCCDPNWYCKRDEKKF